MKQIAAFFDIDGTLTRESLMIKHFKKLVKYEVIDQSSWLDKIKPFYDAYDCRYGDYDKYLDVLAEIYKEKLKGINKYYNDFVANQVVTKSGDLVYRYTRSRIHHHKERDHLIFFISGSPSFLVSGMALKYGATEYRGSVYLIDEEECFTGEVDGMWDSHSKSREIQKLVENYQIDMMASYAYGDTSGDLSMLEAVGNPIVINPTSELIDLIERDACLMGKIKVIVERKDLIYQLNPPINQIVL